MNINKFLVFYVMKSVSGFKAGDLGPFAVLGSYAFNLFIIVGIIISTSSKGNAK